MFDRNHGTIAELAASCAAVNSARGGRTHRARVSELRMPQRRGAGAWARGLPHVGLLELPLDAIHARLDVGGETRPLPLLRLLRRIRGGLEHGHSAAPAVGVHRTLRAHGWRVLVQLTVHSECGGAAARELGHAAPGAHG